MKPDRLTRIGLIIVTALLLANFFLRQERATRAAGAVQYNVVELSDKLRFQAKQQDLQAILDQQGGQGWELVIRYESEKGNYLIFRK
jgi:hypothetical protein